MRFLLLLHLITAIFLAGPLAAAVTTAGRYARTGDPGALRSTARTVKVYGWGSLAVAFFGVSMLRGEGKGYSITDGWVVASLLLYLVAFGLVIGLLVPALAKAVELADAGKPAAPLAGRLAALGGVVSLLLLVITVLMVYKP
ncbi:MAG TPA: DUF2269 family protein [Mycobacteriales bacterium]|nr:DUF2269 family protein [Mycobacteriales bacterium]